MTVRYYGDGHWGSVYRLLGAHAAGVALVPSAQVVSIACCAAAGCPHRPPLALQLETS